MEVFLEKRVVRLHHGNTEPAREPETHDMRHERRVNVDQVEFAMQRLDGTLELARDDHAVFRVERKVARPDADSSWFVLTGLRVLWRDEHARAPLGSEIAPKRLDRRGNPVDARKVDVGKHQDARRAHRHGAIDWAIRKLASASPPPSSAPAATSVG